MAEGMESSSIMGHEESNTLIIRKNANYIRPINYRANLIAGMNSRLMERVSIDGDLVFCKGAQAMGDVKANNVILGPWTVIRGNLTVKGDLLALDHSRVLGNVTCTGGAIIRPDVGFKSLEATGLVECYGKRPAKKTKGKMVTRKQEK
jgi:predicted acyltransferase (DUF342 family)